MNLEEEIVGLLGHAFRRNLINITDLANIVLAESGARLTQENQTEIQKMKSNAIQSLELIDSILALTQIGGIEGQSAPFNLSTLLERVLPIIRQRATSNSTTLIIDLKVQEAEFRGNTDLLAEALLRAVQSLLNLDGQSMLCFDVHSIDKYIAFRAYIEKAASPSPMSPQTGMSIESTNPAMLLDLLYCIRAARSCGGYFDILGAASAEKPMCLQFRLPSV